MKNIIYAHIAIYCIISPFYILKSGSPQISDLILISAFLLFIFNYKIRKDKILVTITVLLFLISIINLTWGIVYSNFSFMLSTVYYMFNFMLLIMILNLYYQYGKDLLYLLYKSVFISVTLQVIISPFLINNGLTRQTLMFNNPNQLGYYALLSFCIITLLFYILKKGLFHYLLISVFTIYLALLSNSSSTILAILVILIIQFILLFFYRFNSSQKTLFVCLSLGIFIIGLVFSENITSLSVIDNMINRLSEKEMSSSNIFYERGYNRIFENPYLSIIGAGEGLTVERFNRGEMHSTLISFLFNYGIIPMTFLIALFLFLIKKPTLIPLIILFSVHFYGLTHNGIRQPFFWLVNALIYIGNTENSLNLKIISCRKKNVIMRNE